MIYLKTYEQLQDFYQSEDKYIITTSDEKYVYLPVVSYSIENLFFPINILKNNHELFLMSESDMEDHMDWLSSVSKYKSPIKIDDTFIDEYSLEWMKDNLHINTDYENYENYFGKVSRFEKIPNIKSTIYNVGAQKSKTYDIKTYEQINDFYKTDDKYLITTQDEEWVAYNTSDISSVLLFKSDDVLDKYLSEYFFFEEERVNLIFNYMKNHLLPTPLDISPVGVYKIHDFSLFEKNLGKYGLGRIFAFIDKEINKSLERIIDTDTPGKDFKIMKFNLGAQKEKDYYDI